MPTPAFDPNQPYEPVSDQKPEFDPSQNFQSADKPEFDPNQPHEPIQESQYSTPKQEALTVGENFAKGVVPFGAQYAENKLSEIGVPGLSPQEQWARQQANPALAKYSKMGGNVAMMMAAPEIKGLSIAGGMALNNAVQMGVMAGGDEYSKALMGHADPTGVVAAHIIGSTALGGAGGLLFGKGSEWLGNTEGMQAGSRLQAAMAGFGHELKFPSGGNVKGMQSFSQAAGTIPSEESALSAMSSLPNIEGEAYQSGAAAL